jgi:hypothetical protein
MKTRKLGAQELRAIILAEASGGSSTRPVAKEPFPQASGRIASAKSKVDFARSTVEAFLKGYGDDFSDDDKKELTKVASSLSEVEKTLEELWKHFRDSSSDVFGSKSNPGFARTRTS